MSHASIIELYPRRTRNKPHVSGFGASVNCGGRLEIGPHFFVQVNAQCGWTSLGDILLQWPDDARASQRIAFFERSWALGSYIGLGKRKKVEGK